MIEPAKNRLFMKKLITTVTVELLSTLKNRVLLTFLASILSLSGFAATITSTGGGGNWNIAGSWVGGVVPAATDNVVIAGNVTITAPASCANLTINAGANLTINGGQSLTLSGNFVDNGTFNPQCCGGSTTVTMTGPGTSISGSATPIYFINLVIAPGAGNQVSFANSNVQIRNGGNLQLQSGILFVGAGNSFTMSEGQSATITVTNGNFANAGDGLGHTDADGGTIHAFQNSGANLTVTATNTNIAQINNIDCTGDANWKLAITNAGSVRLNGTVTIAGSQSNGWQVSGNPPIWGSASTLYLNKNGQQYNQGLEWNANSGTIGVTPGYINNITLVNMGNSTGAGGGFANVGWTPSGALGLNGTLKIGDATTPGLASLYGVTSFNCGGVIIDNNSRLVTPPAAAPFTDRGNFILQGATTGSFNDGGSTINFAGSGTIGTPQIVSTTGASINFSGMAVSNGTYVQLSDPVTVSGNLILTSGYIGTTTTNSLTVNNPAIGAISGGSATAYVDGPLSWNLPPAPGGGYVFPVGDMTGGSTYLPLTLSSGNSSAGSVVTVEAFHLNSSGTPDGTTVNTISPTEYWKMSETSPFTGSPTISVSRPTAVAPYNSLGKSTTSNGIYSAIGGTPSGSTISGGGPGNTTPVYITLVNAFLNVVRVGGAYAGIDNSCNPTTTGSLIVGGVGGTAPYTYSMTSATGPWVGTTTFSPLAKGSYSVWVKDNLGVVKMNTLKVLGAIQINGDDADVTICPPASTTLVANNLINASTYSWAPGGQTTASITVSPAVPTTYTVTSPVSLLGANSLANGSFEAGFTFTAGYAANAGGYGTTPGAGGYYLIGTAGNQLCTFFTGMAAQNGTKYYIADGNNNAMDVFSVPLAGLTIGAVYQFSFWYAKGSPTPPNSPIDVKVSGVTIGSVLISNSAAWTQYTVNFTAAIANPIITLRNTLSPGNTDGNDFYLDNLELKTVTTCSVQTSINVLINCPAPVQLLDFNAERQGAGALLTWSTANEQNSSHYIIEKSTDGISFQSIGKVKAAGNSSTVLNYSFVDPSVSTGITYYRIVEYDINGAAEYSTIKTVSKDGANVQVVPNPNNGTFVVTLDNSGDLTSHIKILNSLGQVVFERTETVENLINVDISSLASGIYYLQVSTGEETIVKKIVKE
jgi:hypothetical protein